MYHTRVFMFDFQEDKLPKFTSDKEHQEFLAMIGRMALYGCHDPKLCDTIQVANGYINSAGDEMVMSYFTLEAQPEAYEDGSRRYLGSPLSKVEELRQWIRSKVKSFITIGAVKRDEGNWSFHS